MINNNHSFNNIIIEHLKATCLSIVALFFCSNLFSQQSFNSAGASVISSNYNMAFTTGEIINQYHIGNNYVLKSGVIQYQKKNPTSIIDFSNGQVLVYPNPVDEFLFIETEHIDAISYQIFDLSGLLIKEGNLNDKITVSELLPSSYCLKILSANFSITKLFIKI